MWVVLFFMYQALRTGGAVSNSSKKTNPNSKQNLLTTSILEEPDQSFHMNLDLQCFDTPNHTMTKPRTKPDGTVRTYTLIM